VEPAALIHRTARLLRENNRRSPLKTVSQSLDQYWEDSLRGHVRSALTARAHQPDVPPSPPDSNAERGARANPPENGGIPPAPKLPADAPAPGIDVQIRAQARMLAAQERAVGREHPDLIPTLDRLADLYVKSGQCAEAQPLAERSLTLQEKQGLDSKRAIETLQRIAGCQLELGHAPEALATLERANALDAKNARTLLMRGIAHFDQNDFEHALEDLNRSIETDPTNAEAFNYLGITQSQRGQPDLALKALYHAVELSPQYTSAHYNLAVVYATRTPPNGDLARQHYRVACALGHPKSEELEKTLDLTH
jgi:tetratricopeptide (TPR) repeat protein